MNVRPHPVPLPRGEGEPAASLEMFALRLQSPTPVHPGEQGYRFCAWICRALWKFSQSCDQSRRRMSRL
jgi:hypothetical protein